MKEGETMKKLKQVGTVLIRSPDGKLVENTPIYGEVEVDAAGMNECEKRSNSIYAKFLAEIYKKETTA